MKARFLNTRLLVHKLYQCTGSTKLPTASSTPLFLGQMQTFRAIIGKTRSTA